jgi:uncharacterized DUF497 family protein
MGRTIIFGLFEWNEEKDVYNFKKHKVSFELAARAFLDPKRVIVKDGKHSSHEERKFCIGKVGAKILTVRFVERGSSIRILGAANWRKERKFYEKENKI